MILFAFISPSGYIFAPLLGVALDNDFYDYCEISTNE